jgi:hypothetical protein
MTENSYQQATWLPEIFNFAKHKKNATAMTP